jgi:DNA replication initiation complex subunit (GINS family)
MVQDKNCKKVDPKFYERVAKKLKNLETKRD